MGTGSAIFSCLSPAAHLKPEANGQLVFVSPGRRQRRNLPNANGHLNPGSLCPALCPCCKALFLPPCSSFIHLNLHRCSEALLSSIIYSLLWDRDVGEMARKHVPFSSQHVLEGKRENNQTSIFLNQNIFFNWDTCIQLLLILCNKQVRFLQ